MRCRPLPIWTCTSCGRQECIGSIAELHEKGIDVPQNLDLHKPYVDDVELCCPSCGGRMQRVPEVIDCWFDSGSMPVAQWHYPFENRETFAEKFPADFIAEGVDQTRGWFYSLLVIGTFLFDQPTYKNCMSLELILDKDGKKMSKCLGNTVDPFVQMDRYGADVLRWYLLAVSPPWLPTRFDEAGLAETARKFFGTLTNTYSFFAMYANIDEFIYRPQERVPVSERAEIDRWVLSTLNTLVRRINGWLEQYDLTKAVRGIADFVVDDLSNWYVRRCRRRFWKSGMGKDKTAAFQTLYECLLTVSRLMAPFAPFLAEAVYRGLTAAEPTQSSVHLCGYPRPDEAPLDYADPLLEERMTLVRRIVELGRSIRNDIGLGVRRPLSELIVVAENDRRRTLLQGMESLILEELNVKAIRYAKEATELLSRRAEPVFKKLGPKFGKLVNQAAEAIRSFGDDEISRVLRNGGERLVLDGHEAMITAEDIEIKTENKPGLAAASEGDLIVALNTIVTRELLYEGLAREFVNRVQNLRKDADYEVTDRIHLTVKADGVMETALKSMQTYIENETLAVAMTFGAIKGEHQRVWEIDDLTVAAGIRRA